MPSASTSDPRQVRVSWDRLPGWIERYVERHPGTSVSVKASTVDAISPDGSSFGFDVPMAPLEQLDLDGLAAHLAHPWQLGIVLVRKGGFAVARLEGGGVIESKVGQRHVQSRSKAGGWSQQRFARRRDNQAQAAYEAAAGYVHEILLPHARALDLLATGGDRAAVEVVFGYPALRPLLRPRRTWLAGVADPRRKVLETAIDQARSADITVADLSERRHPS